MSKATCVSTESAGFLSAITGMRLPTKSVGDSSPKYPFILGKNDKGLAKRLLSKGNVHGKFQRGIIAWLDYNMPRYIHTEIDTYQAGVAPTSSESTLYTLIKECANVVPEMFIDHTPSLAIETFKHIVNRLTEEYGSRKDIPIHILKSALPEGWMQRRIKAFSYQSLKGMYFYRKTHRLPEWQVMCDCIESLPYFEELLIGCKKEDFRFDGDIDPVVFGKSADDYKMIYKDLHKYDWGVFQPQVEQFKIDLDEHTGNFPLLMAFKYFASDSEGKNMKVKTVIVNPSKDFSTYNLGELRGDFAGYPCFAITTNEE